MRWHLAGVWETVADTVPGAPALVNGEIRRTWAEYDDRAGRIAAGLAARGHGRDSKIGIYAYNCNEYLEANYGALKIRGTPINVNYRYTEPELVYLLDNADAEALFFDAQFGDRVAAITNDLPRLKTLVEIDDGSGKRLDSAVRFEDLIASHEPHPRQAYSEDDIYMLYTGGTTGMPKGVMYRHGDFAHAQAMLRYDMYGLRRPETREELSKAVFEAHLAGDVPVSIPACPLMHGTGLWVGAFSPHYVGGCVVTFRNTHFDAHQLWALAEAERASAIVIVGDAFARPMLGALEFASEAGRPYDLSSVRNIVSSGVMFSSEVKRGLLKFADLAIIDGLGSTEAAGMGLSVVSRAAPPGETANFAINPLAKVFNDRDEEVTPGSDEIGMVANGGFSPVGYYKDPEKSARTFRTISGRRYSFAGDFAKVAADGSLILLGRGSNCINTGGEKVFPEEVEEAVKAYPDVADCLVVGAPDERFGQKVAAVVAPRGGRQLDEREVLGFVRTRIAGYKTPRLVIQVDRIQRAPNGKADYAWAREVVAGHASEPTHPPH